MLHVTIRHKYCKYAIFLSEKVPIGESYFMNHMFWGRASHASGWDFFFIHRTFNLLTKISKYKQNTIKILIKNH